MFDIFEGIKKRPSLSELIEQGMNSQTLPEGFGEDLQRVSAPESQIRQRVEGETIFSRPNDTQNLPVPWKGNKVE